MRARATAPCSAASSTRSPTRLGSLAGSERIDEAAAVFSTPLSEPLFILGTIFILLVFFVPGGLASLAGRAHLLRRGVGLEGER